MNKKFVKWQLRQWLPPIIVFAVFLASVFLSTCLYSSVYAYGSEVGGVTHIYQYPETNLLSIFLPALILTFIMPCFVYHFRYRRESADFYRQAPAEEGSIRRHKMLIGLGILLVVISLAFWLGFLLMILRFSVAGTASILSPNSRTGIIPYNLYFGYYPLVWLYLLLFVAAQYCINCFLMGLAGTLLDGILLMLVGQIFLNGLFEFPLIMIYEIAMIPTIGDTPKWLVDFGQVLVLFPGLGVAEPVVFGYRLFNSLIQTNTTEIVAGEFLFDFVTFAPLVLYFLGAGACGYFAFKEKEPSGEYFGKSGPRKPLYSLPIYLAGAASAFLVPILSAIALVINVIALLFIATLFFTLWALGYFVILVIFHRSFRIGKTAILVYVITIATCFLLVIFFAIYNRANTIRFYEEASAYAEYIRLFL